MTDTPYTAEQANEWQRLMVEAEYAAGAGLVEQTERKLQAAYQVIPFSDDTWTYIKQRAIRNARRNKDE